MVLLKGHPLHSLCKQVDLFIYGCAICAYFFSLPCYIYWTHCVAYWCTYSPWGTVMSVGTVFILKVGWGQAQIDLKQMDAVLTNGYMSDRLSKEGCQVRDGTHVRYSGQMEKPHVTNGVQVWIVPTADSQRAVGWRLQGQQEERIHVLWREGVFNGSTCMVVWLL